MNVIDLSLRRARMALETITGRNYYEAPEVYMGSGRALFLAGGITDCPDWQTEARSALDGTGVTVLNPRRQDFPIDDPSAAWEQIAWEHTHLRRADAILFWFPARALQPIALYELGAWSMTDKPLFVGAEPGYERRDDVVIQTRLARPEVHVRESLADVIADVRAHLEGA